MAKRLLLVFYLSSLMSACDFFNHRHYHDPSLKLHKEDYEKITKPPLVKTINPPFRPKLLPFVIPPILTPAMKKKVSLTLHEQIPFKNVLMELGRQAGVGIAISPHITSDKIGMFYSVHQLPFIDVIKDFCFLTNHRFQIQGNRILIEPDLPYLTTYNIQFLNHIRKSENRISVSTDVFSPLENQKRTDNGSESVLSGSTLMDFWKELEQNLKMILMSEKGVSLKDLCHYTLHKQGGLIMVFVLTPKKWTIFSKDFDRARLNQKGRGNEEKNQCVVKIKNNHRSFQGRYDNRGTCFKI